MFSKCLGNGTCCHHGKFLHPLYLTELLMKNHPRFVETIFETDGPPRHNMKRRSIWWVEHFQTNVAWFPVSALYTVSARCPIKGDPSNKEIQASKRCKLLSLSLAVRKGRAMELVGNTGSFPRMSRNKERFPVLGRSHSLSPYSEGLGQWLQYLQEYWPYPNKTRADIVCNFSQVVQRAWRAKIRH